MLPTSSLTAVATSEWQLDIAIDTVRFTSHPHFTAEDTAATALVQAYLVLEDLKAARAAPVLEDHLQALRDSLKTTTERYQVHPCVGTLKLFPVCLYFTPTPT